MNFAIYFFIIIQEDMIKLSKKNVQVIIVRFPLVRLRAIVIHSETQYLRLI